MDVISSFNSPKEQGLRVDEGRDLELELFQWRSTFSNESRDLAVGEDKAFIPLGQICPLMKLEPDYPVLCGGGLSGLGKNSAPGLENPEQKPPHTELCVEADLGLLHGGRIFRPC